ncbi:FAD-dependent monooxygenase [Nocardia sp. NPDC052566]|uniref:FAD-dependent monooxygenase n=1 Tax=Nocardia sp. NPDC052566 TaxID=3364330 RepID=UPI0037CB894F
MSKILVSGGGVAGSMTAYWLARYGFDTVVVEKSPSLRTGGQPVDVQGGALTVLERMGALDAVRARHTDRRRMSMVDRYGQVLTANDEDPSSLEILIDELIQIEHDHGEQAGVRYRFGDSITTITQHPDHVEVGFEHAETERFDLVIGADGVHSEVRALSFGPEARFARYLGCYLAFFGLDNYLGLSHEGMACTDGIGAGVSVFTVHDQNALRSGLIFKAAEQLPRHLSIQQQKRFIADHVGDVGWEAANLLERLGTTDALYFDAMTQIQLASWSTGRVALVGDAAYCAAPTSGRGTSQALIGAYVLAGELATAATHSDAFANFQRILADYVADNQQFGRTQIGFLFAPPTQELSDTNAANLAQFNNDNPKEPNLKIYSSQRPITTR